MSTKFLSRLSDKEIFNLFLRASAQKEGPITLEKIERKKDEFVMYIWSAGDLLPMYLDDFGVIEHICFLDEVSLDVWCALLYKRFGAEYAIADFENTVKGLGL